MKPIVHINGSVYAMHLTDGQINQLQGKIDFTHRTRTQRNGEAVWSNEYYPVVRRIGDGWTELPYGSFHHLVALLGTDADYRFQTVWYHPTVLEHDYPGAQALLATPQGMPSNRRSQDEVLQKITAAHQRKQFATCVIAPCGAGKTHLAVQLIATIQQPTLIIVHTFDLLEQWKERLELAFPGLPVGTITDGKVVPGMVTVATVQTLVKVIDQVRRNFAVVILDEAHHCPATTFNEVLNELPATIKLGLTASKQRRDGLHPLMTATLGPIVAEIAQDDLTEEGVVMAPEIEWVNSAFATSLNPKRDYTRIIGDLTLNEERNRLLLDKMRLLVAQGRHVLVVSSRLKQLQWFQQRLGAQAQLLTGPIGKKARLAAKAAMTAGTCPVTLATLQIGKEGLDAPILDALVWGTPVRDLVTVQQTVGRIQRACVNKPSPLVVDVVDPVGVFVSQAKDRATIYRRLQEGIRG